MAVFRLNQMANSTHQSINIRKYNYICGVSPQRSYAFFILEIAFLLSALINLVNLVFADNK